jgi:hypothetical protein
VLLAEGKKGKKEPLGDIVFYTPIKAFSQVLFLSFVAEKGKYYPMSWFLTGYKGLLFPCLGGYNFPFSFMGLRRGSTGV